MNANNTGQHQAPMAAGKLATTARQLLSDDTAAFCFFTPVALECVSLQMSVKSALGGLCEEQTIWLGAVRP